MVRFSVRECFIVTLHPRQRPIWRLVACGQSLLAFVLLGLTGCQNGPRVNTYIESMAAERRALEDRVYQLEYELDVARDELQREQGRRAGAGMSGRTASPRERSERNSSTSAPGTEPNRSLRGPASKQRAEPENGSRLGDDSMLKPPVIEPGDASSPAPIERSPTAVEPLPTETAEPNLETPPATTSSTTTPSTTPTTTTPVLKQPDPSSEIGAEPATEAELEAAGPSATAPAPARENPPLLTPPGPPQSSTRPLGPPIASKRPSTKAGPAAKTGARPSSGSSPKGRTTATRGPTGSPRVSSIALAPHPTGGVDLDDAPGDDGVTVALDIRDERGERVQQPGEISVVVLDLSQSGPSARVARWDLDRAQVEQLADTEDSRAAMVLHMAWPAAPPKREQLQMHVRYVTEDGRKLEAYRDINVKLPVDSPAGSRPSNQNASRPGAKLGGWRPRGLNLERTAQTRTAGSATTTNTETAIGTRRAIDSARPVDAVTPASATAPVGPRSRDNDLVPATPFVFPR